MTLTAPEWLERRGGRLQLGSDGITWFVFLGNQPQYSIVAVPVGGEYGCKVRQTINGSQIPTEGKYASTEKAIEGGLLDLAKHLGWV